MGATSERGVLCQRGVVKPDHSACEFRHIGSITGYDAAQPLLLCNAVPHTPTPNFFFIHLSRLQEPIHGLGVTKSAVHTAYGQV